MDIAPSPVVELNRAIALAQRDGPDLGLDALRAIRDSDRLSSYPFYAAAMGELELRRGNREGARAHFAAAVSVARNAMERRFLEKRLRRCDD
jgi:RNA polymerase sigma-70 factor (ECF subfamily)